MNNPENTFAGSELRADVDRDRLLAQIAQGLLTAHARLDLMEERLVEATSRAVVDQLASAASTLKSNGQTSSTQLTELKEVLRILQNARDDFSSAASAAIDKQVNRIHAAQNDSLSKLSADQLELLRVIYKATDATDKLIEKRSDEQKGSLDNTGKMLKSELTTMRNAIAKEIEHASANTTKLQREAENAQQAVHRSIHMNSEVATQRFQRQITLIVSCFVGIVAVLVANKTLSASGYYIFVAIVCIAAIILAACLASGTGSAFRKQYIDQASQALQEQRNSH